VRSGAVALCLALAGWAATASPAGAAAAAIARADATLEVSFDEAASVRLRGQRFVSLTGADVGAVNAAVASDPRARVERLFSGSEASLDAARGRLRRAGRRAVPDLNRHYRIRAADSAARDALLAALRGLAVVDEAGPEPRRVEPPTGGDYRSRQGYATPAPVGIGTQAVAARAGGLGQNTKIVDVEYSWNRSHEDLAKAGPDSVLIANGTPFDFFNNDDHGTAVLGLLVGTRGNLFGIDGLSPESDVGLVNADTSNGYALANAVDLARQNLSAGDVLLVEQQADGPAAGTTDYVPVEYNVAVYDAIRLATQSGIIVVEAAGNGGVNLDAAFPEGFPGGRPDSGAIIVGAGSGSGDCAATANARLAVSTFGTRLNLQGWGQCVTTAGYGTLFQDGKNTRYTANFNSTSSASAIVAGAAAVYSSIFQATAGRAPTPLAVRRRLVVTGSPQAPAPTGNIGPLPNVAAAATNFDFTAPTVALTGPAGPTNDTTPSFTFTADEPAATFECRRAADVAFAACTSPQTFAMSDGDAGFFEVRSVDAALNTGPSVTRSFSIDAIAPAASLTSGPPGLSNDPTPTFSFTADDPAATFACRAGTAAAPGSFAPCSSPHTTAPLPEGSLAFEVRAVDAAGNVGPTATQPFAVDTIAPAVSIVDGPSEATDDPTPTFTFTSGDPVASFQCRIGGAPFTPCSSPHTTAPLPDGPVVFEVQATDPAQNTGPRSSRVFTVSTPPPTPPPPPSIEGSGTSDAPSTALEPVVVPPTLAPAAVPAPAPPAIGGRTRATVRVTSSGSVRLPATVSCPALPPACTVTVKARRKSTQLASRTLKVAAGETASIRFTLERKARRALRRSGRFDATVLLTARHGDRSRTRTLQITLKR
jgi:serine protease